MSNRGERHRGRLSGEPRADRVPAGIAEAIAAQGGRVTLARFMELALTHPLDGYYSREQTLLGPRGHFSTAPCLSPEFNATIGRLLEELVDAALKGGSGLALIELGGGEGDLAKAILARWEPRLPELRDRMTYTIVETSGALQSRQRRVLEEAMSRGWRIAWVEKVEQALESARGGVSFGNEFIDALPVHLVDVRGEELREAWVELAPPAAVTRAEPEDMAGATLRETWMEVSAEARAELEAVFGTTEAASLRPLTRDGVIELRPAAGSLIRRLAAQRLAAQRSATQRLAASSPEICLLTIDYGEWYADPGAMQDAATCQTPLYGRTLRGYFRHQLAPNPYIRVGRQDLTADVDFRALDRHGRQAGFETVFFTTLADLLRADGGRKKLEQLQAKASRSGPGALKADRYATVLRGLLDYQGLGGVFKVMLQVKE